MHHVIYIFGSSGSGTTTLGKALSEKLGFFAMDSDDYFWIPTNPPFTEKRPAEERAKLMEEDILKHKDVVISGSLCGWGDPLIPYFTLAVRIGIDQNLRIERLRKREHDRFGARIEPGGDMYESHLKFVEWAKQYDTGGMDMRSKAKHDAWQKLLPCNVLLLDGADSVEQNIEKILNAM